jgi:catechol 2,3-dioxygenase-like lactoylglutathione lyase family enzyme
MIIPNLMVNDMAKSLAFYRDGLRLDLVTAISADREVLADTDGSDAVFAILSGAGGQLMLQSASSLRAELPDLADTPAFTGTIYMRGIDPRPVLARLPSTAIIKPVALQWYGMLEAYVRDPNGYIICLGMADGPPTM